MTWFVLRACARSPQFMRWCRRHVSPHVNTLFMLVFVLCVLLVIATPRCSLWHFPTFRTRTSLLSVCNCMPHPSLLHPTQSISDELHWSNDQLHLALLLQRLGWEAQLIIMTDKTLTLYITSGKVGRWIRINLSMFYALILRHFSLIFIMTSTT